MDANVEAGHPSPGDLVSSYYSTNLIMLHWASNEKRKLTPFLVMLTLSLSLSSMLIVELPPDYPSRLPVWRIVGVSEARVYYPSGSNESENDCWFPFVNTDVGQNLIHPAE
jgi:hypothetical protein